MPPPIPSPFVCVSLYITAYSPDNSTPFQALHLSIRNPVPCPLCALSLSVCARLVWKTPQDELLFYKLCAQRHLAKTRGETGSGKENWVSMAMRTLFHSIRRDYPAVTSFTNCAHSFCHPGTKCQMASSYWEISSCCLSNSFFNHMDVSKIHI